MVDIVTETVNTLNMSDPTVLDYMLPTSEEVSEKTTPIETGYEYTQSETDAIIKYRDAITSRKAGQKTLFPISTSVNSDAINYFAEVTNYFINMDATFVNVMIANTMSCKKIFVGRVNAPPIRNVLRKTIGLYGKNLKHITYKENVLFIWYNKNEFQFTVWSTSYKTCVSAMHTLNRQLYNNFIKNDNVQTSQL